LRYIVLIALQMRKEAIVSRLSRIGIVFPVLFLVAACSNMSPQEQGALSGGAIGAAGGAVLGAVAGVPALGAAIGGAGGAALGAATAPSHDNNH
jgi:osmotically inducible lipoprotein OsmB